ncbi:hypothetical protein V3C10_07515 [[Clostridium] symbiosum]|uniref:hypothetical protein n=1 Tax=Clostridium symbiosum TaxID=1512 RepID=UPI001D090F7D|nr:hypothetical protein [[Clostridium] symbiosum]MCB6607218.1 hypothetical protein [[Clostridium] symbiosum]MCB6929778.1 hypothetical protein [[Clostridium] symbiosum]
MDDCVLTECRPIALRCDQKINRVAFDGCHYYFTILHTCEIIKADVCFHIVECFSTGREYDCICYDSVENCFWASSKRQGNMLFKLACNMTEIDCITFNCGKNTGNITGLSFNCCHDSLVAAYTACVIEVCKCSEGAEVLYRSPGSSITGIISLCPVHIITFVKNSQSYLCIFDECGRVVGSCMAECSFILKDIIFYPCRSECGEIVVDFLAFKKEKYPYLCQWKIPVCCLNITLCPCNFMACRKCSPENDCCKGDACADIMESIAMMEASMARILNAEGEKLQKVLSMTDDIDKILCINREINKTIINATHLEHTLYAKLSALCGCRDGCGCCDDCGSCDGCGCITCGNLCACDGSGSRGLDCEDSGETCGL